jgi:hypothetical protein
MLRPQPAGHPTGRVALWPLSYRRMVRRAGFEPATSRLTDEVSAIFTTDREGVGGERAMLLPLRRAMLSYGIAAGGLRTRDLRTAKAVRRSHRSNRHLHHRLAGAKAAAIKQYAGEQAISVSVMPTQIPFGNLRRGARQPSPAVSTVRDIKGGFRARFSVRAMYPKSSPPASVEPQAAANRILKRIDARRLRRRRYSKPFKVRSAIGVRLAPRSLRQAPRFWARASAARAPGSGSPVPACAGKFFRRACGSGNKKPSGAAGSGGSVG